MLLNLAVIAAGYLMGSITTAVLICKSMGLGDPRVRGSGNPGATNILRLHGRTVAAFTLGGDLVKGLLPVLLARWLDCPPWAVALTGAAAFAGHLYPVFFGFRGGKGVATLVGILLGFHWLLGLAFIATWLLMAALFRYSSLAALSAAACTPLFAWLLLRDPAYSLCLSGVTAALLLRHAPNIRKLLNGTEPRIGT